MKDTFITKAIKIYGNISKMAEIVKISRGSIYNYLYGQKIPLHVAERIVKESNGKIKLREFISRKSKYYNKELDSFPIPFIEIPLKKIIFPENIINFPHQKNLSLSNCRPICVDKNFHLIYGIEHIETAEKHRKKLVFSWQISLEDLRDKKYEVRHLTKIFNLFERIALRNALEKFIGKRQGSRTDLKLVDLPSQVPGIKTRDLVAEALGFGSDYVCRMLNKILQHGSCTLILQVLEEKISISKAGEIAEFFYEKQDLIIKKKQSVNNIDCKNRENNSIELSDFLFQFNKQPPK